MKSKRILLLSALIVLCIAMLSVLASCGMGETGPQGEAGKDGTSLLTGNGEPSSNFGKVGDSYIDLDSWNYYVKESGTWVNKGNIKGEKGDSASADHDGTEGLEFYPINDTECAVGIGSAIYVKEIIIPSTYKHYTVTAIAGNSNGFDSVTVEKIVIPETVTTIEERAFTNCSSLRQVFIPETVVNVGKYAFYECYNLALLCEAEEKPSGWDDAWSYNPAYWGMTEENRLVELDGVWYLLRENNEATLVQCPEGIGELIISEAIDVDGKRYDVNSIGKYAFLNNDDIRTVLIPDGIVAIDRYAFYSCPGLTVYCEAQEKPSDWSIYWNVSGSPTYWAGEWEYDTEGKPTPIQAINGTYGLSHIVARQISDGTEETYRVGDRFFGGMILSSDTISVELNNGRGRLSYTFESTVTTNITYEITEDKFIMVCEDAVDLFNDGNPQSRYELSIEEIDGDKYFVLNASNEYYNFSYYVVKQNNL
ncbi:MAG: leucine-rich repeat domain-containing protein [Clostridia bacterium]|nr:leucine-rich repeat domain-containing protein [Clostridia bacterium]